MKRIFTLFAFAFVFSFNANAQLADGSIAPDFTATDINGVEWNLYSLLDEGKTVILDVSATWCGPCWSYHTGGTLETVWEEYGPEGTNEMFVIMVEGDANTTQADLEGTGSSTTGNWIEGTGYPIIDNAAIANAYEIAYYPTIYAICPNRTVTEIGQVSAAVHYAAVDQCPAAAGSNNGAILSYDGAEGEFCGELTFSPSVKFQNLGDTEITEAALGLYVNGTLEDTQTYEGSLSTFNIVDITFSELTVNSSAEVTVSIESINGTEDDIVDDYNAVTTSLDVTTVVAETATINVNVETDNYGLEVYWAIRDTDGIVYLEGGPAEVGASGGGQGVLGLTAQQVVTWNESVDLPVDGCYEFVIFDDYGDGICCNYGDGFFSVTDANDNVLSTGGTFESVVKGAFEADFTSSVQAIEGLTALTVAPNPTTGLATVTFGLNAATDIDVVVYNVVGQRVDVITQSFNAGVNQFAIDATNYANGVYFVNLNSAEGTSTVKFTVNK